MKDLQLGQYVWYFPYDTYNLLIRCRITEIDDELFKKEPNAFIWYGLDEPIGHNIPDDEISLTKEEAINWFNGQTHDKVRTMDLDFYRRSRIEFIVGTWHDCYDKAAQAELWYDSLPRKVKGVDWFNVGKPV